VGAFFGEKNEEELCLFRSAYDRLDGMLQGILCTLRNDPTKGEELLEKTRESVAQRLGNIGEKHGEKKEES